MVTTIVGYLFEKRVTGVFRMHWGTECFDLYSSENQVHVRLQKLA